MQRISTNATLFLKFFIPIFWIVFFGAVMLATLLYKFEYIGDVKAINFKLGMGFAYITGVAMFAFTLMRLKRVEMDHDFVYVTNYFKNVRYPFHNIERIEVSSFLFVKIASLTLRVPGMFGKTIRFVPVVSRLKYFLNKHPEIRGEVRFVGVFKEDNESK